MPSVQCPRCQRPYQTIEEAGVLRDAFCADCRLHLFQREAYC